MSSAKRRLKRKASILARMDATHHRCQVWRGLDSWDRATNDYTRQAKAAGLYANMRAIGCGRYFAQAKRRQDVAVATINALRAAQNRGAMK